MSLTSIVNGVGNIVNTLFDLSPKSFYSIADFYNFIKKRLNAPMARKHFTVVPRPLYFPNSVGQISTIWDVIFNDKNLAKFAITAQHIKYNTKIGYNDGDINKIKSLFGYYSYLTKDASISQGGTMTISFLLTALPIIETFILPWFFLCNRTNHGTSGTERSLQINNKFSTTDIKGIVKKIFNKEQSTDKPKEISQFPVPKITIDIKFYRMDLISGLLFLMNPTFVYRLTGVYPINIDAAEAKHDTNMNFTRSATFAYNNVICIPGPLYLHLLTSNTNIAFAYRGMSPIQLLNALNLTVGSAMSIANNVKGMF